MPHDPPPVLLVHGWGGSFATTWQQSGFTTLLDEAGRHVVGVDLLGHGTAPKPHDPGAYADLTQRVFEAMPASGVVDAIGFSLGAMTLLRAASVEPHRFRRLVLAGIGRNVFEDDPDQMQRLAAAVEAAGSGVGSDTRPGVDQDQRARVFAQYATRPGNDALALAAVLRQRPPRLTENDLAQIDAACLVAVGDADFVLPADRLVAALPDARFTLLRRTDHFATPESFDFIDATLKFLDAEFPDAVRADGLLTIDIDTAVARLRAGGLVALPTETVYGLAADAEQPDAVARIFDVKGRPRGHPLIVHVASLEATDGWIGPCSPDTLEAVRLLGEICWPGPLTLLVDAGLRVDPIVTGGRSTVGIRVPSHPAARAVLDRLGGGVAAPSANRFGRVSPTTAGHVLDDLGDFLDPRRDAVLDGGPCQIGVESTIVDLSVSPPQVLRAGAIDVVQIEQILALELESSCGPSRASGMLASHYAPECQVVLAESAAEAGRMLDRLVADGLAADVLDRTDDVLLAARLLYADLRRADLEGLEALVVVLPPPAGIGHAIRDRLFKAAAGSRRDLPNQGG